MTAVIDTQPELVVTFLKDRRQSDELGAIRPPNLATTASGQY